MTATTTRRPSRATRSAAAQKPKLTAVPAQPAEAETNASVLAGVTAETRSRGIAKPATTKTVAKGTPKATGVKRTAKSATAAAAAATASVAKGPWAGKKKVEPVTVKSAAKTAAPSKQHAAAELGAKLIAAAADFAEKCDLPEGMTRDEAIDQIRKWLSYLPARAQWDVRLGERSDAGKRPKQS